VKDVFDVRVYAMRKRDGKRRPFEVRWRAAGRARSRSFTTRRLADSYRAELVRAARRGQEFSPDTGEPAAWAAVPQVTWLEHAMAFAAMKWPDVAAHTRAGIADALATITPALTGPGRRPPAALLRSALYRHAFTPAGHTSHPGPDQARALDWARKHSLPVTALSDPAVVRAALTALTLRIDGGRAAATTIARKRAVFHACLSYAAELSLLPANPLDTIRWRPPAAARAVDPRLVPGPGQVTAILAEVNRIAPELTAFFGCLYYAALRPSEAVALRAGDCHLPARRWGTLTLDATLPRTGSAWTGNGTPHEHRGLKHRPAGSIRQVPIPPQLITLLRGHVSRHGTGPDGLLFRSPRGGVLREGRYSAAWQAARLAALGPDLTATPIARRPYDLRHAALSLWLAAGVSPADIAARAVNSSRVVLDTYTHQINGHDQHANDLISHALNPGGPARPWPVRGKADGARNRRGARMPVRYMSVNPGKRPASGPQNPAAPAVRHRRTGRPAPRQASLQGTAGPPRYSH